jgi:hypothetical protein
MNPNSLLNRLPRPSLRGTAVVALIALVGVCGLATARSSGGPRCAAPHSQTILLTVNARVYRVPDPSGRVDSIVWGCWRPTGHRMRLDTEYVGPCCDDGVRAFRFGGEDWTSRYLGWIHSSAGGIAASSHAVVADLKRGRIVHRGPSLDDETISQFAVSPTGSLAWIGHAPSGSAGTNDVGCYGLHLLGPAGNVTDVDCGDGVDHLAVGVHGAINFVGSDPLSREPALYWTSATGTHSTPFR